jgi:hypothetical protein
MKKRDRIIIAAFERSINLNKGLSTMEVNGGHTSPAQNFHSPAFLVASFLGSLFIF